MDLYNIIDDMIEHLTSWDQGNINLNNYLLVYDFQENDVDEIDASTEEEMNDIQPNDEEIIDIPPNDDISEEVMSDKSTNKDMIGEEMTDLQSNEEIHEMTD